MNASDPGDAVAAGIANLVTGHVCGVGDKALFRRGRPSRAVVVGDERIAGGHAGDGKGHRKQDSTLHAAGTRSSRGSLREVAQAQLVALRGHPVEGSRTLTHEQRTIQRRSEAGPWTAGVGVSPHPRVRAVGTVRRVAADGRPALGRAGAAEFLAHRGLMPAAPPMKIKQIIVDEKAGRYGRG